MKKILLMSLCYIFVFWIAYVSFFSFSSFSHRLLGYDINTLEEWLYSNRLFIVFLSKIITLFLLLILPAWSYSNAKEIFLQAVKKKSEIQKKWKINDKSFIAYIGLSFVLYALFYNFDYKESEDLIHHLFVHLTFNMGYYLCDVVFLISIIEKYTTSEVKHSSWKLSILMSTVVFCCSLLVSQKPIFEILQVTFVLFIIFQLITTSNTTYTGWLTLFIWTTASSLIDRINVLSSSKDSLYTMNSAGLSLPWSVILIMVYILYLKLPPYIERLYNTFFMPKNY